MLVIGLHGRDVCKVSHITRARRVIKRIRVESTLCCYHTRTQAHRFPTAKTSDLMTLTFLRTHIEQHKAVGRLEVAKRDVESPN